MTKLNSEARRVLADAGITVRDWITYGGWLTDVTDEAGNREWIPETEWRGDECGCTDDRCIGHHHDEHEECGCLPALIQERTKAQEAYDIWQDYRAAVEANDGRGDQDAYDAAWSRAEAWVRRHYARALTFSLDAVVKGERGISATYPALADGSIPNYVGATPEGDGYRQQLWTEGTDPNGHVSPERAKTMFRQGEDIDDAG